MLGSVGATATLPIDSVGWSSKIGWKVVPPFCVLNRPPVPVATKNCAGFPGTSVISLTRPPMLAGPIDRHERDLIRSGDTGPAAPGSCVLADVFSWAAAFFFGAAPAAAMSGGSPIDSARRKIRACDAVRTERRADDVIGILQRPRRCRERVENRATGLRPSTGCAAARCEAAPLTPLSASRTVPAGPTHEQDADPRGPPGAPPDR